MDVRAQVRGGRSCTALAQLGCETLSRMRRYPRRAEACCGVLSPCWVRSVHGGQKPDVGLENMKGILRGKKTCGLSKGVSEVGAHKGDSLTGGRGWWGWWWWCQHEESILKVGGLARLIKSSVCVSYVENQLTRNKEGVYTCEQLNLGC